ncbi:MAG: hypothetical protein ISR00_06215 [Flavobacteriales bacterium]|nr:hypothetical protein [Flavobacteriales bacterium]MBL6873520.1 hypothetical protein [Flavobacteriales bacterium]
MSEYWLTHYHFNKESVRRKKHLEKKSLTQ